MKIYFKLVLPVLLLALVGCSKSADEYDYAANISSGGGGGKSEATFDPANGVLPQPNNLAFGADGTLNIPIEPNDPAASTKTALNMLDGFSTIAPIATDFGTTLDQASLVIGQSVRVFEVTSDPATGAVTGVTRELTATEIFPAAAGQNLTTLAISPLQPLKESTTYMVVLTNGIKDSAGAAMQGSTFYFLAKQTTPFTDPDLTQLEPLRQLVNNLEAVAATQGINSQDIILSWHFTTINVTAVMNAAATQVAPGALLVGPTGQTTNDIFSNGGTTQIYAGTLTLPYYLEAPSPANPKANQTGFWKAASGNSVTRFEPTPVATGNQTIPVLMTVPAGAAPPTGWPVVIFQHGITQDRSNLLPIADTLAAAGFAGIAIDMPLHGITDPSNPLGAACVASPPCQERHFSVDLADNATGAPIPDGMVDGSGQHFINLFSLLTSRDNIRQAAVDLMVLRDSLAAVTAAAFGVELDETRVNFVGHSLGGIVGTVFLAFEPDVTAATLAMPGGGIARLLDGSATFGPRIAAGLGSQGVNKGTPEFDAFMVAAQTAIDAADPANHAAAASAMHPIHMIEVVGGSSALPDQVIPNSVPGAPLSGTEPLAALMGLAGLSNGSSATGGLVRFVAGDHGSILDPTASPLATQEMQIEVGMFMATDGANLAVTDTSVVQQ
ncbi:MAG TPA: lipase [Chromatiales bacterium]|nr:lipase [Thiotrichales bacterium]HIP69303.1 lipase [Chromatiales bacterium]